MGVLKALLHGAYVGVTGDTTRLHTLRAQLDSETSEGDVYDTAEEFLASLEEHDEEHHER